MHDGLLTPAALAAAAGVPWDKVRGDIAALMKKDEDKGPTLVRLAWHSSGTYDKMQKNGGSGGGTIRFAEELAHGYCPLLLVMVSCLGARCYHSVPSDATSQLTAMRHRGNAGLDKAVGWLEPIYKKYAKTGLSHADLYTFAGAVAIVEMGGPAATWRPGRVDEMTPEAVTPDGRLPNADSGPPGADKSDADHIRKIFYRMGLSPLSSVPCSFSL